ncbi:MAG: T9SS type A sorting domain-containing protein [Fidelibacterota bacterium]|nr:MAG: T9SS type A sorting domain-containing protein [Candidatus Neomarinimicrobiota bacterium]
MIETQIQSYNRDNIKEGTTMRNLVKGYVALVATIVALSSVAYGIVSYTVTPQEVPKGAYANGADGDQVFIQALYVKFTGVWAGVPDTLKITLPDSVYVADINNDGTYSDEISFYYLSAPATFALAGVTSGSIWFEVTAASPANNDELWLFFPIETEEDASADDDYTFAFTDANGAATAEGGPFTVTISYEDQPDLITWEGGGPPTYFNDKGSGKTQTDLRGKYFPDGATSEVVSDNSLPQFIVDPPAVTASTLSPALNLASWVGTFAALNATDTDDILFYLWVSDNPDLTRVNEDVADRVMDYYAAAVSPAPDTRVWQPSYDGQDFATSVPPAQTGVVAAFYIDEGDQYFYVTSDVTGEWVVGRSDTVEVRHQPVFSDYASAVGTGLGYDTDWNDVFNPVDGVTDDPDLLVLTAAGIILESGGSIDYIGNFSPTNNHKYVDIYWNVEDVDDNAYIYVFRAETANLDVDDVETSTNGNGFETVTGLTGATMLDTTASREESSTAYRRYNIYTSDIIFETAGTYYFYVVLNDGNNQAIRIVDNVVAAPPSAAVPVTVKHFPYFAWHPYLPDDGAGPPAQIDIDAGTDRYVSLSWANPPLSGVGNKDGDTDLDAGGAATITLYAAQGAHAAIVQPNPISDAALLAAVTAGTAVQIGQITDNADTRDDNRYDWDVRNAGLTAATDYYLYAVMEDQGDKIVVQYNSLGYPSGAGALLHGSEDDEEFNVTYSDNTLPMAPYAGPPVELDQGDMFRLTWDAFNTDPVLAAVPANYMVKAVAVKEGASNPGTADWNTWDAFAASDDITCLLGSNTPASNNGLMGAAGDGWQINTNGNSYTFTVSDIINRAGGGALTGGTMAAGNWEVYYFFTSDGAFSTETPVKAPGVMYITGLTTTTYSLQLSPNKASMSPGDTMLVDILATTDGTNAAMASFFIKIPQSSYFTILDQFAGTAGTQPFDNAVGAASGNTLNGDVLLNNLQTLPDGSYLLGYLEKRATGSAALAAVNMVSFQIAVTGDLSEPLERLEIDFYTDDTYVSNLYDLDGSPQSTSIPPAALDMLLGKSGEITGVADIEGRDDEGETIDFYLVETGGATPLTNASFLDANDDSDGSDGVQITLDGGGYYTISGVPTGEYDLIARHSGYLDAIRENIRVSSMDVVSLNFAGGNKLFGGDAAGFDHDGDNATPEQPDNEVDVKDTDAIADAYGTSSGQPLWNAYADIDESGEVDINDLFMASRNRGKAGDGIFYKEVPGTNNDAMIWLAQVDETAEGVTFAVRADGLVSLGAYAIEMLISSSDWELAAITDGLNDYTETTQASRIQGDFASYGSAVIGHNAIQNEASMDLMYLTLRPLATDPELPNVSEATLIDANGGNSKALIGGFDAGVPEEFSLSQNYPNPFNPVTTINFSLPTEGRVKLAVYNLLGQELRTLVTDYLKPGTYKAVWNSLDNSGRKVPSGMYFYRLVVDNRVIGTHKMVLLK